MGWQRNYVTLKNGDRIRYSLFKRPGLDVYFVRFKGVDTQKWVERSTGSIRKPGAVEEAHRIIQKELQEAIPTVDKCSWAAAKERLSQAMRADGKREKTIHGYIETIDKLIAVFRLSHGPADISENMASEFKTKYACEELTIKRRIKRKEKTVTYTRKTKSLDSRIRTLKAVFGWFRSLRLVNANPFAGVAAPELDRHEVKYVREEDVADFFRWLEKRYRGWTMPRLFFSVKAATACRLQDICLLQSAQLRDGRLVFTADITKNRSERYATLPPSLYAELEAYKGKTFLWERYPAELIVANNAKGFPTHRQNPTFSPQRLYLWVVQLMQIYQKETSCNFSSHDFRKAAFTRAAEEDIHPKRAATAFDVTPETMLRYYTATEKKVTADEVLSHLANRLLPPSK